MEYELNWNMYGYGVLLIWLLRENGIIISKEDGFMNDLMIFVLRSFNEVKEFVEFIS